MSKRVSSHAPSSGLAGVYAFAMGAAAPGTHFDSFRVQALDSDGDGVVNDDELAAGTDPEDADSDDGGWKDGEEDLNGNGAYEPQLGETDPNDGSDDGQFPDGGPDADADTDADAGADTDSDVDADADTGAEADSESADGSAGIELRGGPSCDCAILGGGSSRFAALLVDLLLS